jgi:hypothetical protein
VGLLLRHTGAFTRPSVFWPAKGPIHSCPQNHSPVTSQEEAFQHQPLSSAHV